MTVALPVVVMASPVIVWIELFQDFPRECWVGMDLKLQVRKMIGLLLYSGWGHLGTSIRGSISFPEPRSPWPAVGKQELWEQPFWNNNGNNRILPIRSHAVCIYGACLKWMLPEPLDSCRRPEGSWALGTRMPSNTIQGPRPDPAWSTSGVQLADL